MNTTTELDIARAENTRLQAENARLRAQLERCQYRAMEIVRAWGEYHELGKLRDRLALAQRPPARKSRNGHSSRPVADG
jgi:hypothetical protein